jgi:tetratricopeptide (TPR) repeat protein
MHRLGDILTFYSYKGGVGRSMGLVNIAVLLAKWKRKVLIIDWDLEAPGIESYFRKHVDLSNMRAQTPGVVDLVQSLATGELIDWHDCLIPVRLENSNLFDLQFELKIISAGRNDDRYISRVQHTDWEELFKSKDLGSHLETLRNAWKEEFDFVLIDSRTGITDLGGICTIHLPDVLAIWFTTNETNVQGAKHVAEQARIAQDQLPFDRNPLLILPVPSRDESRTEFERATEWQKRFAKEFGSFYREWLPKDIEPTEAVEKLRIPYVPYWSFEEGLPVAEEDPSGLGKAYEVLARLLFFKLSWKDVEQNPEQSIEYLRRAAEVDLDRYGPELASGLFDRALDLWKEELKDEATETTREAVETWEKLAIKDLGSYGLQLARAKKFLSELLQDSDEQEAIIQAKGAVDLYLKVYQKEPTRVREEVATSLVELSDRIHNKESEVAIETLIKAIEIQRTLVRSNPRFEVELARTHHDLANWYIEDRQFVKGLDSIQESVSLYRSLASTTRDRFDPDFAESLVTLSECLLETGDLKAAVMSGHEAVEIYKRLVARNPRQYEAGLVKTFNALLDILSRADTSIGPEGVTSIEEAVVFFRMLAEKDPKRYEFELAKTLNMLPEALLKEGRTDEALVAQKEAVEILRRLGENNPNRYESEVGQSLLSLSRLLFTHGDNSESQAIAREAVKIFEKLAKGKPAGYKEDLEEAMRLSGQD